MIKLFSIILILCLLLPILKRKETFYNSNVVELPTNSESTDALINFSGVANVYSPIVR
jgi:hypothetical protein